GQRRWHAFAALRGMVRNPIERGPRKHSTPYARTGLHPKIIRTAKRRGLIVCASLTQWRYIMRRKLALSLLVLLALAMLPFLSDPRAAADDKKKDDEEVKTDVVYWPTPQNVVDKMLEMAKVKKDDIVYDLGCGDCRIPVTAAKKYGCKAYGYDI